MAVILGLYIVFMVFSNLPFVSKYLSRTVSQELSEKFGTKVSIQSIHIDISGRINLLNTSILDKKNDSLLYSAQISARLKPLSLFNHQIIVNDLNLFDTYCHLYKANDAAKANYQFLIDSLSSNKNSKGPKMDFLLRTFIIRNLNVTYDNLSKAPTNGLLNISHLDFRNVNGNFRINKISRDSLSIRVRKLQLEEKSGLKINHLAFNLIAGPKATQIKNFKLIMPQSSLEMSNLMAINQTRNEKLDFLHNNFRHLNVQVKMFLPEFGILYSPLKKIDNTVNITATINKNNDIVQIYSNLTDNPGQLLFQAHTDINLYKLLHKQLLLRSDISNFQIETKQLKSIITVLSPQTKIPDNIDKIGKIDHRGLVIVRPNRIVLYGNTACNLGSMREHIDLQGHYVSAKIETHDLDISSLINRKFLSGPINSQSELSGSLTQPLKFNVESTINNLRLNDYVYKNIRVVGTYSKSNFDGNLKVLDNNLSTDLQAKYNFTNIGDKLTASINIIRFNPEALHLIKNYANNNISAQVFIKLNEFSPTPMGIIKIHNFNMKENDKTYAFDSLILASSKIQDKIHTTIASDLLDAHINGNVNMVDVPIYFYNFLKKQVHVLPSLFNDRRVFDKDKYALFDIHLKRSDLLEHLTKIPIHFEQMPNLSGFFDTTTNDIQLTAFLPSFTFNGSPYKDGSLFLTNQGDSLSLLGQITKTFNHNDVKFVLNTEAYNNSILSQMEWKMLAEHGTQGFIKTKTSFSKDKNGVDNTHIQIFPSIIYVNDSIWTVNPSLVDFKKNNYQIHNFMISHGNQYIAVSNTADSIANGKGLLAKVNEIDLGYVFDILNFHPVEFDGKASGFLKTNDLSENKDVNAQLTVNNFKFNTGDMGTLLLNGKWDNANKMIHFDAKTQRTKEDSTFIKGFVNVGESQINLTFTSVKTNMEFLNQYFSSFMSNLSGQCTGKLRLYGPLNAMNLEGQESIDELRFKPKALNVTYHITNDSITFAPGKFIFKDVTLNDEKGNSAKVNGEISHRVLHDFKYDLKIDAKNLLAYDWNEHETNTFWGTVYSDGNCRLWGTTDAVHVDMDMTPQKNTTFVYDSSNPVESDNKGYIHFTKTNSQTETTKNHPTDHEHENEEKDASTDTYLNFKINTNPNATLVVLTDRKTGDNISLRGSGPLHINYYNKGKFSIFGNYLINDGLYKITIRDVIHKSFQMQQGGIVRFNGSPMDGDLNMKGVYTINSVSLADLNLGNLQNTTANVDCILYFKGKCASPEVSFDLDFSNVNDEEKQMVRNMIASQGDMNMQIIYLLSIGRFFTYDYSNYNTGRTQNQSSVAMKSLLASTLSEQFNTMLSNALHINNWKFGTNISTGRVGWSDMEVEGLLSGSLLNNRVLINGNFGYRDQAYYTNNFVGDFNIRWLLTKSGIISLKAYSETNDRYFTKTSLTTNGAGILFQRDFNSLKEFFGLNKKKALKN